MAANKNATMSGVFAMHANLHNFLSGSLILCVEILDDLPCNARSRIHQIIYRFINYMYRCIYICVVNGRGFLRIGSLVNTHS